MSGRTLALFEESKANIHHRADRLFAKLMIVQWLAGIAAAAWISPRTWIGARSETHWHVWAAFFLGGAITALPVFLVWKQPGRAMTRHVIAVAQMLTSALLIHLTGGRIETHFHVFGSLAFFAFYRDWRVLLTATVVVALDHMARGIFWPQSVFGVLTTSPWRWIEHAGWVIFEDSFLFISIQQSLADMLQVADRRSRLEALNANIERQVEARTAELTAAHAELQKSEQRFRTLSGSAPIGIFLTDASGNALYTNPQWLETAQMQSADSLGDGWQKAIHPEDCPEVLSGWRRAMGDGDPYGREFRFRTKDGAVRWVHARSTPIRSQDSAIAGHVGTLEDITERKRAEAELEKAHEDLVDASRLAGMAEVATGVLHNVGNVLNSVNVSANFVTDKMRKSLIGDLPKITALLREHSGDLGPFLTSDPKGKQLATYIAQLSDHLCEEHGVLLGRMDLLRDHLDHIKQVVAMQQEYAKVSGVVESIPVTDLVEDAIRLNVGALSRHHVEVIRDYDATPTIVVDKHKALQILVNLIRNAKSACGESGRPDKRLTLRITSRDGRVRIGVVDNGLGIPPENFSRIFSHGFTTRKDGHGFGLHSGALAAKEMGGSIEAHSDGVGLGAAFTLDLPLKPTRSPHVQP
ncbi:MAG: PAS domain S-box protein [Verrucomicrobia bacterium]|nr:PAS domain S-box protein [Verrucomicrobiota bacterium]